MEFGVVCCLITRSWKRNASARNLLSRRLHGKGNTGSPDSYTYARFLTREYKEDIDNTTSDFRQTLQSSARTRLLVVDDLRGFIVPAADRLSAVCASRHHDAPRLAGATGTHGGLAALVVRIAYISWGGNSARFPGVTRHMISTFLGQQTLWCPCGLPRRVS